MSTMKIGKMNIDHEIYLAQQRLYDQIFGVNYFTVVFKIDGKLNYSATARQIMNENESRSRQITAWSLADEITRLEIIEGAINCGDLRAAKHAMSEYGIGSIKPIEVTICQET